jgi:hypothetical protein
MTRNRTIVLGTALAASIISLGVAQRGLEARAKVSAAADPAGPAPTTATFLPFGGGTVGRQGFLSPKSASERYRLM